MIEYYSINLPKRFTNKFGVPVESVLVVPVDMIGLVVNILRGENKTGTRYAYKTVVRKNDVLIGVQFAMT